MESKEAALKNSTILAAYLLIVWGFYRILFKFPDNIEDYIIKPVFWLIPVFYLVKKDKLKLSLIGLTWKNLFPSVYSALALGILFTLVGVVINYIKYKGFNFVSNVGPIPFFELLPLTLATGISEEITFRGYIFSRVWLAIGNEWKANIIVSFVWALIHVPVALFWWKLNLSATIGILILTFIFGVGSSYIFARTKNIASSILLHMLWEWPIILFR